MKKCKPAFALAAAATFFSLLIFSCGSFSDMGIPENVYVKTSGTYSGAFGAKYFDLSEKFGDDFIADLSSKAGGDIYKYVPDESDKLMKYLLHKKLYDVPLDASKYLEGMNLEDTFSSEMAFAKEFSLPSLDKSVTLPILSGATGPFPFEIIVNVTLDQTITAATVGSGSIVIAAEGSGADLDIASFSLLGMTKGDGSAFGPSDFTNDSGPGSYLINKKLDLAGAKITIPLTQLRASGSIALTSGAISTAGQLRSGVSVQNFSSVAANFSGIGGFEMNDTTENKKQISKEMVAYVNKITFGQKSGDYYYKSDADGNITSTKGQGKGIKFKAVNSFPVGNDIQFDIVSETFGIDSTDGSIYDNGEPVAAAKIHAKGNENAFDQSFAEFSDITVSDPAIFGDKDNPKYIMYRVVFSSTQNFVNLALGQTYKISVSDAQMLFDWDMVNINLANADPVEDAVDLADFSIDTIMDEVEGEVSKLVDNCEFETVPVYFFVQKPDGSLADTVGDISLEGKVFFEYTGSDSVTKKDYVAGGESETSTMYVCDSFDWPEMGTVFTKKFETLGTDYSFSADIADTMNARPSSLTVNYSMAIAGGSTISLYKARFDTLGKDEKSSIAVEMAAELPFKVRVTQDTDLDIYELSKMDMSDKDDLMDRTSVSKTEEFAKYVGAISLFQVNYNFINTGVNGFNAVVKVDDTHEGEAAAPTYSGVVRSLDLTGGADHKVVFTSEEIKAILTHFFKPKMTMTVKKGVLSLNRDAVESTSAIGVNPTVLLQLNDSVAVDIKDIIK